MGAGYFIIAIMGCADGAGQCVPVATVPTRYESQASCSAGTAAALEARTDLEFPTLVAQCRSMTYPASADKDLQQKALDARHS